MILGIDLGEKKTGISISDEANQFAMKYKTISTSDLLETITLVRKIYNLDKIIFGYPLNEDGTPSKVSDLVDETIADLNLEITGIPIERVNETLSSKQARINLKKMRKVDSEAARIILQDYLNMINKVL